MSSHELEVRLSRDELNYAAAMLEERISALAKRKVQETPDSLEAHQILRRFVHLLLKTGTSLKVLDLPFQEIAKDAVQCIHTKESSTEYSAYYHIVQELNCYERILREVRSAITCNEVVFIAKLDPIDADRLNELMEPPRDGLNLG
jgi:hypothetical protein